MLPSGKIVQKPLDLVGEDVRCRHLHGRRQVENDLLSILRFPDLAHARADFDGKFRLRVAIAFGRVFESPCGSRLTGSVVPYPSGTLFGNFPDTGLVKTENLLPLDGVHGIVNMHDGSPDTAKSIEGSGDQVFPDLGQNLDRDVFGNVSLFDEMTEKPVLGARSRRKSHFDFLEPHPDEQLEETKLCRKIHGRDECLVSIP